MCSALGSLHTHTHKKKCIFWIHERGTSVKYYPFLNPNKVILEISRITSLVLTLNIQNFPTSIPANTSYTENKSQSFK